MHNAHEAAVRTKLRAAEREHDALTHIIYATPEGIDPEKVENQVKTEQEGLNMSRDFSECRMSEYMNRVDSRVGEHCEDVEEVVAITRKKLTVHYQAFVD